MHHAVKAWCIVSTSGRLAIKTPGIHYEYRGFSDFLTLFEMAQLAVLGHFWVTWVKNLFSWVTPSGFRAVFLCLFSEQHIGDTLGSLGFVLLNDVGIEALGSVHGCVSQLLGHGNNIRSICQEDGGNGVAEGVGVDMGQSIVPAEVIQPSGNAVRMQPFPVIFGENHIPVSFQSDPFLRRIRICSSFHSFRSSTH